MGVYTKKGDKGRTSLFGTKKRYSKSSKVIEAIGNFDELNSYLGILDTQTKDTNLKREINRIQNNLFTINAIIAGSNLSFSSQETKYLEGKIDAIEKRLPKLTNFVLPGGNVLSSNIMYARTLARRAERFYTALLSLKKKKEITEYVNRLSDYLFMLFREEIYNSGIKEKIWKVR